MKQKNTTTIALAVVTMIILWLQARHTIWNNHLQVDIWVFWERLDYWLKNSHSFAGLRGNEILPATLIYMFIPVTLVPTGFMSYANYLPAMMLVNFVIIFLHSFVIKNKNIFWLSLLSLGPILLFRFDGLVTLFALLSFKTFEDEKYPLSGFWLGLATAMKVFPIIFLPYLCIILLKKKMGRNLIRLLIGYGEALLLPVVIFFFLGGNLEQIRLALSFHSSKLISIESIPGSFITGLSLLNDGRPPTMLPGNGIWGVEGPANIFNKLWIIPTSLFYMFVIYRKDFIKTFSWTIPFTLMLIFLVFSKNLNPQYLWWFMVFLPFVKPSRLIISLTLIAAFLNQLVFPIFYTTFTQDFYQHNLQHWVYYLLLLRNILLIAVAYLSLDLTFNRNSGK